MLYSLQSSSFCWSQKLLQARLIPPLQHSQSEPSIDRVKNSKSIVLSLSVIAIVLIVSILAYVSLRNLEKLKPFISRTKMYLSFSSNIRRKNNNFSFVELNTRLEETTSKIFWMKSIIMGYSRHFQSPSWPQSTLLHQNRSNFSQSTSISMRTFSTFFFTRNPGRCFLFQDGRQYRMLSLPATSSTIGYFLIHGSTERPDTDDDHQVLQEPSAGAHRRCPSSHTNPNFPWTA